jgi:uncharacterized integral membrane protein
MSIRLSIFLIGILILFILLLGNTQSVEYYLILYEGEKPLGIIILVSAAFGGLLTYIYLSHIKSYKKLRTFRKDEKKKNPKKSGIIKSRMEKSAPSKKEVSEGKS